MPISGTALKNKNCSQKQCTITYFVQHHLAAKTHNEANNRISLGLTPTGVAQQCSNTDVQNSVPVLAQNVYFKI